MTATWTRSPERAAAVTAPAMAVALAELGDLPRLVHVARGEIEVERRPLVRGRSSPVGGRLAAQAAPRLHAPRPLGRARSRPARRGAFGAQLWARAQQVAAGDPDRCCAEVSELLAARAGVGPADLSGEAAAAWGGSRPDRTDRPGERALLASSVLEGTLPAALALPPAAAGRVLRAEPPSRLFGDEPESPAAHLEGSWRRARQAALQGLPAPAGALLRALVDALWVGGDGCEAPFAIAGLAALLSPATALALTIGASEAAMARNARRFHLRLAGLVLAQLLSA